MVRYAVVTVRYAWLTSVCTCSPRARTDSSKSCCCAFACDTWSGWEKLLHNGMLIVRRAWNGCGVKLNGYAAFWSRIACACCGVKASRLQLSGNCPAFSQAVFSYWHAAMLPAALADSAAIVGLMSESFCVNPDQLADTETLGVYAPVAARTPQRAAPSRARSALSAGFCSSAIVNRSPSRHAGVWTANVSVSCTVATSTGGVTPICWNSSSFSSCSPVSARSKATGLQLEKLLLFQ